MGNELTYTFSFERLDIWQLSRKLASDIYALTALFPEAEKFGLINQLRRAAISVSSNIAEGSARRSLKDQAYMIERAYGSCTEITCQLIIAMDLNFINQSQYETIRVQLGELTNKINSYIKQLRARQDA